MQVNHLLNIWLSGNEKESRAVRGELERKIDSYATGELEHAVDTMAFIWDISNKEGPIPSEPASPSDVLITPCDLLDFTGTRRQLVKSAKEGYLLDRKYWARRSRKGRIEPIYFSGAMCLGELSCLDSSESLYPGCC